MEDNTIQNEVIHLTPAAVEAVRSLLKQRNLEGYALRVFVSHGGCSGFQYGMALEKYIRPQDLTVDYEDVKVVVDEVSIEYLRGSTVDYVESVMGSGFKIDNPNAIAPCGCGNSFRTKDSEGRSRSCC